MCQALRGNLDPEEIQGTRLEPFNTVGRFLHAREAHERTSVAAQMRKARKEKSIMGVVSKQQALTMLPDDYKNIPVEVVRDVSDVPDDVEDTAILAQSTSEGIKQGKVDGKLDRSVTFMGERFRIANKVGLMPLMEFAYFANSGADTGDMGALVSIYEMLRDCLADEKEFKRFTAHAKKMKADAEDMMPVVRETIELLTARPTLPPSDSSSESPRTSLHSMGNSSGQAEGLIPVAELERRVSSA